MGLRALFRLHAGRAIGLGHGVRCLALADELGARGWSCRFAVNPGAAALLGAVAEVGHEIVENEDFDDPATLAPLAEGGVDLLVCDSYSLDAGFETPARAFARRIAAVDDLADRPHDADLLIDATLGRTPDAYAALTPAGAMVLTGPGYALLAAKFARARVAAVRRRLALERAERILVTLGGAPPADDLARLARAVRAAAPAAEIDVAAGGAEALDLADDPRLTIHRGHVDMAELTARADLGAGAGGGSAWERCCLGLPALLVGLADNQRAVQAALAAAGAAVDAGPLAALDDAALTAAIGELVCDGARLKAMAAHAALVCDGLGARRAANAIEAMIDAHGPRVTLRPATSDDGEAMLAWQQTPEVRRFANDPHPPTREEHFDWLERRLADPLAGPFEIIEVDGAPAGVLRFDLMADAEPTYRVSILVAPERQGRGVAARALSAGGRLLADAELHAEVLAANAASHRLFARAGYRQTGPELYRRPPLK